jgi:2-polyprenyl-3-methyl-5-hydroxy-6-metoxy-1,4-benzoquinol methylase
MPEHFLKSMKLYYEVERVFRELRALGIEAHQRIPLEELSALDQYHYLGTDAVDEAIHLLAMRPGQRVLDVGSGIGGPARYIAHRAECWVTALEIQPDLHITAAALTERCGLENRVEHVCGDILEWSAGTDKFDALVSWLAFLHIRDREALLRRCFESLRPGEQVFDALDDFYRSMVLLFEGGNLGGVRLTAIRP